MEKRELPFLIILALPVLIVVLAFFLLPMGRLAVIAAGGENGLSAYLEVFTKRRYFESLISTTLLAGFTTLVTLAISTVAGLFFTAEPFLWTRFTGLPADVSTGLSRRRSGIHGHPAGRSPGADW